MYSKVISHIKVEVSVKLQEVTVAIPFDFFLAPTNAPEL